MEIDGKARTWVQGIAAAFLCVAAAVSFAAAGGHPAPQAQVESSPAYVPPGMHEAQAGEDIGPGSDEAKLVTSPWGD